MEFQNYYRELNVPTMCVCMVVQPRKFINMQGKRWDFRITVGNWIAQEFVYGTAILEFTSIQNMNDGILELLLEIECPHNLCMVLQSLKRHQNQKG